MGRGPAAFAPTYSPLAVSTATAAQGVVYI